MGRASYCPLEQRQPLGFSVLTNLSYERAKLGAPAFHTLRGRGTLILGLSIQTFTIIYVVIGLMAIAVGIVVLIGMFGSHRMRGWTAFFLLTTILTSVTGFLFLIHGFTSVLGIGIASCVLLALALCGLYGKHLAGAWRWIYVACISNALYLNVLVLIVLETAGTQTTGANPVRAVVPDSEGRCTNRFSFYQHCCGAQISPRPGFFHLVD